MRVIVAGGTGFLGRALTTHLRGRGDEVVVLSRRASAPHQIAWDPSQPGGAWVEEVSRASAVVNLAGEPMDGGRWTAARKTQLVESRIAATRAIARALADGQSNAVLLNASAVGFYGSRGNERLTEDSGPGDDFLAHLCQDWEREAEAAAARSRVVLLRTGLVLDAHAGALARLLLPFRLGLGGPLGNGLQYWSWIHRDDWVRLVVFAIDNAELAGPCNLTAPHPVTNLEFVRAVGRALHRPALLPAPAFALKLMLGEMAEAMVLAGQRALPGRAQGLDFRFTYAHLDNALRNLIG
jgi:uncharacterized protein (TIGR01777 family)